MRSCHFSLKLGRVPPVFSFFFNDTATTEIYPLSLHDALPIWQQLWWPTIRLGMLTSVCGFASLLPDRKSTRLNSSHDNISYAVFCLKKKKKSVETTKRTASDGKARPYVNPTHHV